MNTHENYFDTGLEWIGKIPSSWEVARSGKFFTERSEKVDDVTYPPLSVTMNGIVNQLSGVAKSNVSSGREEVRNKIKTLRKTGHLRDAQSAIADMINLKSQQRK